MIGHGIGVAFQTVTLATRVRFPVLENFYHGIFCVNVKKGFQEIFISSSILLTMSTIMLLQELFNNNVIASTKTKKMNNLGIVPASLSFFDLLITPRVIPHFMKQNKLYFRPVLFTTVLFFAP